MFELSVLSWQFFLKSKTFFKNRSFWYKDNYKMSPRDMKKKISRKTYHVRGVKKNYPLKIFLPGYLFQNLAWFQSK